MLKVATIVGTRPELIKLSCVIRELRTSFDHTLIHTGQNFDARLRDVFFSDLDIAPPEHSLNVAGSTSAETIANSIRELDRVLPDIQPDAILVLGDTNSCLGALAAKKRHIPIFHMEAGNRCFDERVPEEVNRRIIDHFSDINLVYTEHARRNLLREGLSADRIVKTGSPMNEVLAAQASRIAGSSVLSEFQLEPRRYLVLSLHREENVDDISRLHAILSAIDRISAQLRFRVFFSVHPRTRKRLEYGGAREFPTFIYSEPIGFLDYIKLQTQSFCVLSDSGTLSEEAALLGFPAVTIREAHERPEGLESRAFIMSDLDPGSVRQAVDLAVSGRRDEGKSTPLPDDYRNPLVSKLVANVIASYTSYVNRNVWNMKRAGP